ncbi:MAG TPA: serine/threonine protein kinase [Acidobacteria bacterium]|nr:serine/threonine protein kinase [Acidobacteriota bacterium]
MMARGWARKARWAALRGDYSTAGDLYRLGGELSQALKMYQKGRHHRLAGQVASELGEHSVAAREYEMGGMTLEAAEMALRCGDRERAARLFVQANQARRAAEIHEQLGHPEPAATLYEHTGDFLRAARLFIEARCPDKAERCLESLLRAGNVRVDQREVLGLAARLGQQFLASGIPDRGARWLERSGRSRDAATAWARAHRPERAIRAFLAAGENERAAEIAEKLNPGEIDPELAAEAFRAASRWAEAAALYLESGHPSQAAGCLEQLGCSAEAAWAHEAAGDIVAAATAMERAGDYADAARHFRESGAIRDAARCLEACGQLAEAAEAYEEAGERLTASELFERCGDVDAAVRVLQGIASNSDEATAAAMRLGRLFERLGMDSVAADHYRRGLADPERAPDPEGWYRLAGVLERTGKLQEAAAALGRVVALELNYRDASQRLAQIERRIGEPPDPASSSPDRYTIEGPLEGYVPGHAFLAIDRTMERRVVLRRFAPPLIASESAAERILADIRRIARLHHPAIAAIHDAGRDGAGIFVVEDHVPGKSLREILATEGPLDVPRAIQVITRLAEALDYSHGLGLLARNLRPENVIVSSSFEARLIDFGIGLRHSDDPTLASAYRTPESMRGERSDPSSDIYLLGVLAWEMLTGKAPPPPRGSQAPVLPEREGHPIPDLLQRVVRGCLVPDRSQRVGSAQELLEELHGTHLLPGALLANRYEILREIGRGGMGTVFAARDLVLEEPVALKVLSGPIGETVEKRFIQEIRLTRQINHPNIVRVHTFERWRELRFIVMEYIDGVDLRQWAGNRHPIPLGQVLEFISGVASGLAAAHRLGIVHRDVKPENVLLDQEGRPRLVDFGIARQGDVHLTREGLVMGSPAYMAPEQIRGEAADQRADLYAIGVLTYFLLTGREPFASDNVAEVLRLQIEQPPPPLASFREGIPQPVEALVSRLLSKDPNQRPASVFSLLEELTAVRARLAVVTA